MTTTWTSRGPLLALAASLIFAVSATPARAGLLVQSAGSCDPIPTKQVFLPWLDPLSYVPVKAGDFESGATGWKLAGGAKVVTGNEPFKVAGAGSKSLLLPSGASVTSPTMCAGLDHLVMRYFARSQSSLLGSLLSTVRVDVLFELSGGAVGSLPVGLQPLTPSWAPSLPVPVIANLLPLLPGSQTPVAFRFTAQGPASWTIDDVYLDPRARN